MDLQQLEIHIKENKIDAAIQLIEEIGTKRNEEAIPLLIKHLKATDSHILRNEIALALSDIGSEDAVRPIIELLSDPKTKGARGTLLYALKPLDYSQHFELLVDIMINGNYEAQQESKQLIMAVKDKVHEEVLHRTVGKVRKTIMKLEEKMDFLTDALQEISDLE